MKLDLQAQIKRVPANKVAKGYVSFFYDEGQVVTMTDRAWAFLISIGTGRYAVGAQIKKARTLEERRLAILCDYGIMKMNGRVDGERWWATRTLLGDALVQAAMEACDR